MVYFLDVTESSIVVTAQRNLLFTMQVLDYFSGYYWS